jgi:hypothetical protein
MEDPPRFIARTVFERCGILAEKQTTHCRTRLMLVALFVRKVQVK